MGTVSHPYEFKLIKAKEITVDRLYQRDIQKGMVKEIVGNFDYHKVNCVKVIYRDGQYFAFDGQQTTTGLRSKFGDNYMVPCLVYYDVPSWIDEAELFEKTNAKTAHKNVGARDLWTSRLNRGEEVATSVRKIVEKHGLILSTKSRSDKIGQIRALEAVDFCYGKLGNTKFEEMINILSEAWGGSPESLTSPMLRGMAHFVNTFYGEYNKKRLISKLKHPTSLGTIIAGANSGTRRGGGKVAEEIASIYNKGMATDSPNRLDLKKI